MPSLTDFSRLVLIGRCDQPEIGLDEVRPADALDFSFLDRPQQLGLELVAQIADFVEEQRATAG